MFDFLKFYTGEMISLDEVVSSLDKFGYSRCRKVSVCGDYSLVGETLIIYPATFEYPVCIDFSRKEVKSIKSIDLASFKSINDHNGVIILPVSMLVRSKIRKRPVYDSEQQPIDSFIDIEPGDFVVHIDYGIGK